MQVSSSIVCMGERLLTMLQMIQHHQVIIAKPNSIRSGILLCHYTAAEPASEVRTPKPARKSSIPMASGFADLLAGE